jgi:hypothetical protein
MFVLVVLGPVLGLFLRLFILFRTPVETGRYKMKQGRRKCSRDSSPTKARTHDRRRSAFRALPNPSPLPRPLLSLPVKTHQRLCKNKEHACIPHKPSRVLCSASWESPDVQFRSLSSASSFCLPYPLINTTTKRKKVPKYQRSARQTARYSPSTSIGGFEPWQRLVPLCNKPRFRLLFSMILNLATFSVLFSLVLLAILRHFAALVLPFWQVLEHLRVRGRRENLAHLLRQYYRSVLYFYLINWQMKLV